MKKETPRTRRSLRNLVCGGSSVSAPFDDDEPPSPPQEWANAAEMLHDQFGLHTA